MNRAGCRTWHVGAGLDPSAVFAFVIAAVIFVGALYRAVTLSA